MNYIIEKGVALPKTSSKYPLPKMEVGDSFKVPVDERIKVLSSAQMVQKKTGFKFTVRKDGENYRIWRIK